MLNDWYGYVELLCICSDLIMLAGKAEEGDDPITFMAPSRFERMHRQDYIWNGKNHRHCCTSCRCLTCTSLRWMVRPHCSCQLPTLRYGYTLEHRMREKRRVCRHKPRHRSECTTECKCAVTLPNLSRTLPVQECDLGEGNPTGPISDDDIFIDT